MPLREVRTQPCSCGQTFQVEIGSSGDYQRLKKLLNKGHHPAFIGRNLVRQCARNGGLFFFQHEGQDAAAAVVNPRLNVLLVLNVRPEHRGHGLGCACVAFLQTNWVRSISSAVHFFERCGYEKVGAKKLGIRLETQIMVRRALMKLAGRLQKLKLNPGEGLRQGSITEL